MSAPVHASVSGKVVAIGSFPHSLGMDVPAVVIESDGKDEWAAAVKETPDYLQLSPEELKKMASEAGIVGMGGATFPTHVKLSPPKEKPIDVIILNGAECEPYLTSDHRLMLEKPTEIVEGLKILMRILNVRKGFIGIDANKPDAIEAMKKAAAGSPEIAVFAVQVKYPAREQELALPPEPVGLELAGVGLCLVSVLLSAALVTLAPVGSGGEGQRRCSATSGSLAKRSANAIPALISSACSRRACSILASRTAGSNGSTGSFE